MRHNLNATPLCIYGVELYVGDLIIYCVYDRVARVFLNLFRQLMLSEVTHEGTNH